MENNGGSLIFWGEAAQLQQYMGGNVYLWMPLSASS